MNHGPACQAAFGMCSMLAVPRADGEKGGKESWQLGWADRAILKGEMSAGAIPGDNTEIMLQNFRSLELSIIDFLEFHRSERQDSGNATLHVEAKGPFCMLGSGSPRRQGVCSWSHVVSEVELGWAQAPCLWSEVLDLRSKQCLFQAAPNVPGALG